MTVIVTVYRPWHQWWLQATAAVLCYDRSIVSNGF